MNIEKALQDAKTIFLDTAPIIYYVENHVSYFDVVSTIFNRIDGGELVATTSPITLAECLVLPYRQNVPHLQTAFQRLIVGGKNTKFVHIDARIGRRASQLRATYNLGLPDALQLATALETGCDTLLTNDTIFKRVTETKILMVHELTL